MSLAQELEQTQKDFQSRAPESVVSAITSGREEFIHSYDPSKIIKVGDKFPPFSLTNATNGTTSSAELLAKGALLVHFYRGEWCPFCNLDLRAIQKNIDTINAKGASLVAITPELPDEGLTMTEKHELKFPVLSDTGMKLAHELGIVWRQPEAFGKVFNAFGHDMEKRTGRVGGDALEVPIPATILIGKDGFVKAVHCDPDYTKRLEPAEMLKWLDRL